MKQPKKIYLPDPEMMLIWSESTNDVINRKFEYISVDALKEWVKENSEMGTNWYAVVKINKLFKFLNDDTANKSKKD